jgi:hypothetical protein
MLRVIGYGQPADTMRHVFALLGFTLLFLGFAWIAFIRADADA